MNKLLSVLTSLWEARTNKETAKDQWLNAMDQGADNSAELKTAFHAADDAFCTGAQQLEQAIGELKSIFCFELALSSLDRMQTQMLQRLIAELRLDHLTAPDIRPKLPQLALNWYRSEGMLTAARTLLQLFQSRDDSETIESIIAGTDYERRPQAWTDIAAAYAFVHQSISAQDTGETGDSLVDTVLHFLCRHLLKQYDDQCELFSDALEDVYYSGGISSLLEDLEDQPEVCRAVQEAVTSGLVRQRQTAVEEKPETRGTIVADPEEEFDPDEDEE